MTIWKKRAIRNHIKIVKSVIQLKGFFLDIEKKNKDKFWGNKRHNHEIKSSYIYLKSTTKLYQK